MDKLIIKYSLLFLLILSASTLIGQSNLGKPKTILDKAHDRKISTEEFAKSDEQLFQYKIYTVDKAVINKTHHWFIKLADLEGKPLNFSRVDLTKAYLKTDPKVKFTYGNAVFPLCSEGKYIIGFVKVKHSGTWVLEMAIDNFGKKDTLTYEIFIPAELTKN